MYSAFTSSVEALSEKFKLWSEGHRHGGVCSVEGAAVWEGAPSQKCSRIRTSIFVSNVSIFFPSPPQETRISRQQGLLLVS
jgi:hypothetical protein